MKKRKATFLGYAAFLDGEPFPSSSNTVTRNRHYLRTHALFKLNRLPMLHVTSWQHVPKDLAIKLWRAERRLSLRRVYAR